MASLAGFGCGLLDDLNSLRGINFNLPKKSYSISTDDPRWKQPPPGGVPAVPCGAGGVIMNCCMPAPGVSIDCTRSPLECSDGTCALKFTFEQVAKIDLVKEVPALANVQGKILSDILLKTLEIDIGNGLNVMLPSVDLYIAPADVTSVAGGRAHKLAQIPSKAPGFQGHESVPLDGDAQARFSSFAKDFQTPFNFIVAAEVLVKSGTPTPQGKLDVSISGQVEARF